MSSRILTSFKASIGDIVFGMEDGTVSIFGLVFGLALTTNDSQTVLIAGATGAAAAAVSMMAGSYLDAESVRDARQAAGAPADAAAMKDSADAVRATLIAAGMPQADLTQVSNALERTPHAAIALRTALATPADDATPVVHALWMFVANLIAGFTPVLPFALLAIESARLASLSVTAVLLLALGIGRGLVARRSIVRTTLETLSVATAAAVAGIAMGHLLS